MKIVKIKMLQDFTDSEGRLTLLKGNEYFAIDGGDYWAAQRYFDSGFTRVIPKGIVASTYTIYAEVVPTHTDPPDQAPSSCPGCHFCNPDRYSSTFGDDDGD